MRKIRITKSPKTGDQRDYSLVHRQVHYIGEGDANTPVKNTMGAVPPSEANIEVEGGETVVGDVNRDGFLEHMTFVGKRHSEGGMPANIPEGSFIFSDTKKLKIKDKEILKQVFGLNHKAGGYTPAEIAKRYQINQYIHDLKSPDTDAITKRSATQMLANNMEKLGMLALVQESMKGFPEGVPAIAESVMAGLQGQQIPGMEQGKGVAYEVMEGQKGLQENEQADGMKWGGSMRKYPVDIFFQDGGKVGESFYVNGKQYKINRRYEGFFDTVGSGSDEWVVFDKPIVLPNGDEVEELPLKDYLQMRNTGKVDLGYNAGNYFIDPSYYTSVDNLGWGNQAISRPGAGNKYYTLNYSADGKSKPAPSGLPKIGDTYKVGNKTYKVVDNAVTDGDGRGVRVQQINDPDRNISSYFDSNAWIHGKWSNGYRIIPLNTFQSNWMKQKPADAFQNQAPGADVPGGVSPIAQPAPTSAPATTTTNTNAAPSAAPARTTAPASSAPAATPRPAGKPKTAQEALNYFMHGGQLGNYQGGGTAQNPPAEKANQRVDPNQEIFVGNIELADGTVVQAYYKGSEKYVKDSSGNILARGTRTDTQFSQYGSTNINQLLAKTPNVRYTETNFGSFGNQPRMGNTGIYLSSGNAAARKSGDLSEKEWQDFKDRHGDWLDKEYTGGFEQYKKDLLAGQETGDKAAGWFQDKINEKSIQKFGVPYFADANDPSRSPYKRDSKFGQVTYSVPRFFDTPKTTEPGQKTVFYCVEGTEGTGSVVAVNYKEGEQPVAPSGAKSGPFNDRGSAEGACVKSQQTTPPQPPRKGPWWLQDIVNFTGTLTDRVNRYEPTQGRIDLQTPGYTLLDPTRQLAANQEQMARLQDQSVNTMDGNVAMASMLGASGQGFANAANVMADTENRNVGIVNQAYMTNAQINNQEAVANETGRQKYVEDMATLNQQVDNAEQQKKWRQIAAFNNGTSNWFRKKQMEQVLFPQVYIDPILGDAEFSGQGRDLFGPYTYSPAYADMSRQVAMNPIANVDQWNQIYQEARATMGDQEAKRYATNAVNQMMSAQQRQFMGMTPRQQFNQMAAQGLTLPVPLREYGGEMYLPWVELD